MPDEWEIKNRLNPEVANANGKDLDKTMTILKFTLMIS